MELTSDQALEKAIKAHKAGKVQEAHSLYTAILKEQPKHPDANHNMGVLAVGIGKFEEAIPLFKIAIKSNPYISQFWLSYIDALIKLERLADAKAALERAKSNNFANDVFAKLDRILNVSDNAINISSPKRMKSQRLDPNILDKVSLNQALHLAKKQYKEGKLEEAKITFQDILRKFPKNIRAIDGIKILNNRPIGKTPKVVDPPKFQIEAIINLYRQKQFWQTVDQVRLLLQQFPKSVVLYNINGAANAGLRRFDTAISSYKKAITIQPGYSDTYNNMGLVLKEQGKLKEALETYKKALEIKPDYAEAYNNMGVVLKEQGKLEEAIKAYTKALDIKADHAQACYNMGVAFREQGKLEEALETYKNALEIKPDYAEAYNNMGLVLKEQGKLEEAIKAYTKALDIKADHAQAYYNMGIALKAMVFFKPNAVVQKKLTMLLNYKTIVRPVEISQAAISLVKFEPGLQNILHDTKSKKLNQSLQVIILELTKLPLLLKLMSICPLTDLDLEVLLRQVRYSLLSSISTLTASIEVLKFQSALALQCFINEYIYTVRDDEKKLLRNLEQSVKQTLYSGGNPSVTSILCLASYKTLHDYEWCHLLTVDKEFEEVYNRQVLEPQLESHLRSNIPTFEKITNKVSKQVRKQYEESPYPRWVNLRLPFTTSKISEVIKEGKLRLSDFTICEIVSPSILIAGCGTGQHSIESAMRFEKAKVLAVDLSLSSLAYAKRKTNELNIKNIDYMQADILSLRKVKRQFDIIESVGVLHHMDDPMAGWSALTECLKIGGLMKIGLYSQLARQQIIEMRDEIHELGIGSSEERIKSFRSDLITSTKKCHQQLRTWSDFYSLSEVRDLLFHVQEHRFNIAQINDCLDELGLKFCGFEDDRILQNFLITNSYPDDLYDLSKWQTYEKANPDIFKGMYQFWCQKVL